MKKFILVTADENDADYRKVFKKISGKDLKLIQPMIDAIKAFKPYKSQSGSIDIEHNHNFPTNPRTDLGEKSAEELYKEKVGEECFETFWENYVPHGEYGIHTIVAIEVFEVARHEKFYEHRYS